MKQQVVVLHGGDSFATTKDFLKAYLNMPLRFRFGRRRGWKSNLPNTLGDAYDVLLPHMPRPYNAKYKAWKSAFEKRIPSFQDKVIFIGHSMGGVFLAKYLSEETYPKKIHALLMVASPFDRDGGRILPEFAITNDLSKLQGQVGRILLYHSYDDPIVDFEEFGKFARLLPHAAFRTFTDRGHFLQSDFTELVNDVKSL